MHRPMHACVERLRPSTRKVLRSAATYIHPMDSVGPIASPMSQIHHVRHVVATYKHMASCSAKRWQNKKGARCVD